MFEPHSHITFARHQQRLPAPEPMVKFLVDENLSPRVAKYLMRAHQLDAVPLFFVGSEGTPDSNVRALARQLDRVIITLDRDFDELAKTRRPTPPGILWLNPPQSLRTVEGAIRLLDRFFLQDAQSIDLENSIVEIGVFTSTILHRGS